jgi:hypothetical protein
MPGRTMLAPMIGAALTGAAPEPDLCLAEIVRGPGHPKPDDK